MHSMFNATYPAGFASEDAPKNATTIMAISRVNRTILYDEILGWYRT